MIGSSYSALACHEEALPHFGDIVTHFRKVLPKSEISSFTHIMKMYVTAPYFLYSSAYLETGNVEQALLVHEEGIATMERAYG